MMSLIPFVTSQRTTLSSKIFKKITLLISEFTDIEIDVITQEDYLNEDGYVEFLQKCL